jgi:hypothetical protein
VTGPRGSGFGFPWSLLRKDGHQAGFGQQRP